MDVVTAASGKTRDMLTESGLSYNLFLEGHTAEE